MEHQNPKKSSFFDNINNNSRFYFVHSYYFDNEDDEDAISTTHYGSKFTSSIKKNNIYGVQFHPEKVTLMDCSSLKTFQNNKLC